MNKWCPYKGIECENVTRDGYCTLSACNKQFNNTAQSIQVGGIAPDALPDELIINSVKYRKVKE